MWLFFLGGAEGDFEWRDLEDAGPATFGGLGARLEVFGMFGAVGSVEAPDDQGSVQGRDAFLIW